MELVIAFIVSETVIPIATLASYASEIVSHFTSLDYDVISTTPEFVFAIASNDDIVAVVTSFSMNFIIAGSSPKISVAFTTYIISSSSPAMIKSLQSPPSRLSLPLPSRC